MSAARRLWRWRGVALAAMAAGAAVLAARPDTPWWEAGADPVRDLAFVLLLAAPVVVVLTMVAGLLGRRVRLRLALDVVAAAWTWWVAWIVAASLESRHAELTTPRLLYLLDVAYGMALVAGSWWIEERISARHLDGEARAVCGS